MEDDQFEDAARSFQRTLVLSPAFSKVYQLLAQCQVKLDRRDEAVATLKEGFKVADQRGDKMPRDDMAKLLTELGEERRQPRAGEPRADRRARFRLPAARLRQRRRTARKLPGPPIPDALGKRIAESICADCWQDWFSNYSIKVINELRLGPEHGARAGRVRQVHARLLRIRGLTPMTAANTSSPRLCRPPGPVPDAGHGDSAAGRGGRRPVAVGGWNSASCSVRRRPPTG